MGQAKGKERENTKALARMMWTRRRCPMTIGLERMEQVVKGDVEKRVEPSAPSSFLAHIISGHFGGLWLVAFRFQAKPFQLSGIAKPPVKTRSLVTEALVPSQGLPKGCLSEGQRCSHKPTS